LGTFSLQRTMTNMNECPRENLHLRVTFREHSLSIGASSRFSYPLVNLVRDEEASPLQLCRGSSIEDRRGPGQRAVAEIGGLIVPTGERGQLPRWRKDPRRDNTRAVVGTSLGLVRGVPFLGTDLGTNTAKPARISGMWRDRPDAGTALTCAFETLRTEGRPARSS
jgi:hypothetical protein